MDLWEDIDGAAKGLRKSYSITWTKLWEDMDGGAGGQGKSRRRDERNCGRTWTYLQEDMKDLREGMDRGAGGHGRSCGRTGKEPQEAMDGAAGGHGRSCRTWTDLAGGHRRRCRGLEGAVGGYWQSCERLQSTRAVQNVSEFVVPNNNKISYTPCRSETLILFKVLSLGLRTLFTAFLPLLETLLQYLTGN